MTQPPVPTTDAPAAPEVPDVPDAAPVVAGAPVVKQTERPHPLTPFIRGWIVFVAIVLGFGRQLLESASDGGGLAGLHRSGGQRRRGCPARGDRGREQGGAHGP